MSNQQVSIHAPVMDAKVGFYSYVASNYVSIHAPVMDANDAMGSVSGFSGFNPRARDGRESP